MSKQTTIILGTIMLTFSGIASRVIGFLYRIFLSNLIGAKGLGLFQMIFPYLLSLFLFHAVEYKLLYQDLLLKVKI